MIKEEHYFWLNNGKELKSIRELSKALEDMPDDVFSHHVNEHKNDFHSWIKDVHKDERIAGKIEKIRTKEEMKRCIENFFNEKRLERKKRHLEEKKKRLAKKKESSEQKEKKLSELVDKEISAITDPGIIEIKQAIKKAAEGEIKNTEPITKKELSKRTKNVPSIAELAKKRQYKKEVIKKSEIKDNIQKENPKEEEIKKEIEEADRSVEQQIQKLIIKKRGRQNLNLIRLFKR